MTKGTEYSFYILSSFILFLCSFLFMFSLILNTTIYSERFYTDTFDSEYITKLKSAFLRDMNAQSSYTGIPVDVISAGIDDDTVREMIDTHVASVLLYLRVREGYTPSSYPPGLFYDHLKQFIDEHARDEGYTPSDEQYDLLWHVAEDSAQILNGHINILDIGAVQANPLFISAVNRVLQIKRLIYIYLVMTMITAAIMIYIGRKDIQKPLLYVLTSLWLCAVLYLIPSIVFYISAIPSRLAIATPYISHATKGLTDKMTQKTITYSAVLFVLSSCALMIRLVQKHLKLDIKCK